MINIKEGVVAITPVLHNNYTARGPCIVNNTLIKQYQVYLPLMSAAEDKVLKAGHPPAGK